MNYGYKAGSSRNLNDTMERCIVVQCSQCKSEVPISSEFASDSTVNLPAGLEESFMLLEEVSTRDRHGQGSSQHAPGVEDSFVMLPQNNQKSSTLVSASTFDTLPTHRMPLAPLEERTAALTRIYHLTTLETAIDQPLCVNCAAELEKELQEQLAEVQQEVSAYEALAAQLESATNEPSSSSQQQPDNSDQQQDSNLMRSLIKAQEEVHAEEAKLKSLERQLVEAENQLAAVELASKFLDQAEDRYWHAANALTLKTNLQLEERDELAARVAAAERSLATLQRTNVFADVFKISYDGPFGTISGLRLGRTPDFNVEWEEINAAWGQAIHLLDSLAKALDIKFRGYTLDAKGSYSSIIDDGGNVNQLWGPVSKVMCPGYDRAQVAYLSCLKQFAEALALKGAKDSNDKSKPFVLTYAIEGDRVRGHSIRYALSRDKAWTKALKYMLVDLKFSLLAAVEVFHRPRGGNNLEVLPREGPLAALRL